MSACPICQRLMNPDEDAIWEAAAHMICIDAVAMAVLNAQRDGNRYARTIAEALFKSAREIMIREQVFP